MLLYTNLLPKKLETQPKSHPYILWSAQGPHKCDFPPMIVSYIHSFHSVFSKWLDFRMKELYYISLKHTKMIQMLYYMA